MSVSHDVSYDFIFHQVKMKVKQFIAPALRPSTEQLQAGIERVNRQLNESFDVTHEIKMPNGRVKQETLLRVQIKLTKYPSQLSSKIVNEIVDCLRVALNSSNPSQIALPTIQNQKVRASWHQPLNSAPLLLLEEMAESYHAPFADNLVRVASTTSNSMTRKKRFAGIS